MKKLKSIRSSQRLRQYLIVGIAAFISEYLSFTLLTIAGMALIAAQSSSFLCGLLVSFFGNRNMTFSKSNADYALSGASQLWRYMTLAIFNLILSNIVLYVLVEGMLVSPLVAKVIVMGAVVGWNYLIFSRIIFRAK